MKEYDFYLHLRYQNEPYRVSKMHISQSLPYVRLEKLNPSNFQPLHPKETIRVHLQDTTVIPDNEFP